MSEAIITKSSPSQTTPVVGIIITFGFGIIRIVFVAIASERLPHAVSASAVRVKVMLPEAPVLGIISGVKVFSVPAVIVAGPEIDHW